MKSFESIYESIMLSDELGTFDEHKLHEWLGKYTDGDITIDHQNRVSVDGNVRLSFTDMDKLPCVFDEVSGYFTIGYSKFKTLEGVPRRVGKFFAINSCLKLKTLDHFPEYVGGDFYCVNNEQIPRTELHKIVDRVSGSMFISSSITPEEQQLRHERDAKNILKHDKLGSLDI